VRGLMSVDRRIISVLSRVLGKDLVDVDWNDSLASFGLDSLETMDFLYELEKEFNVARLYRRRPAICKQAYPQASKVSDSFTFGCTSFG